MFGGARIWSSSDSPLEQVRRDEESAKVPQLKALLAPYPSQNMICWPVSPCIGNVNDPSLIEPVAAA